jgi:mannose-1-phosphate guanylyltransferase
MKKGNSGEMKESIYAVIMAGGGGTRLWPLSRMKTPKQTLRFKGERSLFQMTVDRLLPLIPLENIFVVTVSDQKELMHDQFPELVEENFIIEPAPRGTASVVGLAAAILQARDPESVMCCLPADHYIENDREFRELILSAALVAEKGQLVTLGIRPGYPATGYGYIHAEGLCEELAGFRVHPVQEFKEKPDQRTAEEFTKSGDYYWNSGMFIWRTDRILEEFKVHMPELSAVLTTFSESLNRVEEKKVLAEIWMPLNPETIDYGIMEKAEWVSVVIAENLGWFDIGSWDGLFDLLDQDDQGNVLIGQGILIKNVSGSLVMDDTSPDDSIIALIDVSDLIIIRMDDVLLVCKRGSSERVREIVKILTKAEKLEFL